MELIAINIIDLPKVAAEVVKLTSNHSFFAFYGDMGVGKTTLIKEIIKQLGGEDLGSPTYSLVNECEIGNGDVVYHFDFYRIESEEEAFDMGVEEYFSSGNLCFVEWPERIENLLPNSYVSVVITEKEGNRIFQIEVVQ